jgi:hypothetical protein
MKTEAIATTPSKQRLLQLGGENTRTQQIAPMNEIAAPAIATGVLLLDTPRIFDSIYC